MKYIKIAILFLTVSLTNVIHAQKKLIDSLENELKINKTKDTTRVNNLDHLSFLYYRKNIDKAIEYVDKAEALAKELKFNAGIARAAYTRGVIEMAQSNYDLAIKHYKNAVQLYSNSGVKMSLAACYNGLGVVYSYQGDTEESNKYYEKAIKADKQAGIERNLPNYIFNIAANDYRKGNYPSSVKNYKKALELFRASNHTQGISSSLRNIALIYSNQGNSPLALDYQNEALSLAEKIEDSVGISNSLSNIGNLYKGQKNYDKALELFIRSLAIYKKNRNNRGIATAKTNIGSILIKKEDYSSAIKYFTESIEISRNMNDKYRIAQNLSKLGFLYTSLKEYDKSTANYKEAIAINKEIENLKSLSFSYNGISDNYMAQKKYSKALPNILKSLDIANQLNLVDIQRDAHKFLSEIYKSKGYYKKALESHQTYKSLNDSLFNKENVEKITQIEYEYKYKKALDSASIKELQLKKTVTATHKSLEKSQRNLLLGVIIFLAMLLILGTIIFFMKLRHEKAKTQNIVIEQKLLRSQMTPHFIFNSLSVLQGMILNKEDKKAVFYLSKFSKLLRITLENSRDKTVLLKQELEAINNYLELQNLEDSQSFEYTILVDEKIDKTEFNIPPMLIQPFIENAIEHAFKDTIANRKIDIKLKYSNKKLTCTIADNGIGIDAQNGNKNKNKTSLATTITSERLKMLSKDFNTEGSIKIEDRKKYDEQGTMVTLVIPYKLEAE